MEKTGFQHKKSLGQHFLNNDRVPKKMAEAAHIEAGETVIEIGPGTGVLTRALLEYGAHVIALEADQRAIEILEGSFESEIKAKKLVILHADVRNLDLKTLPVTPHQYKVVANIPYYLSGMLFRIFLDTDTQPSSLVFLVQKEVASRIARDPKESLLSLSVKAFGVPSYIETIKKGNFTPLPKVDSAIIAVQDIGSDRVSRNDAPFFFKVLHVGFGARRKQLLGNLTELFPRETLIRTFSTLNLEPDVRAEDLSIETWLELVKALREQSLSKHYT